ncbi:MAG: hypothetical protein P3T54_07695 [Dehalogenimonas sp.]|uniref:IPT/TIG domain-containing protein n=1 Tax=Candidatus Dehalogenimonas loeffleri TaxID=3127115 RepID=A0ABZ2J3P8_9CHLR|nr:hypothetical protein [Dehalogenimonas sp.]
MNHRTIHKPASFLGGIITGLCLICWLTVFSVSAAALTVAIPASAYPGDTINISGTAEYNSTTPNLITIEISNIGTYSLIVPSNGKYTASVSIGLEVPGGVSSVIVSSSLTGEVAYGALTILPKISINISSGRVGEQFIISGRGFAPSKPVDIYFFNSSYGSSPSSINPEPIQSPPTSSSESGAIYEIITVPKYPQGSYSIVAADDRMAATAISFSIIPSISLPDSAGGTKTFTEGNQLAIAGTGFAAGSTVTFKIDNLVLQGFNAAVLADGSFANTITLPALSRGNHNVVAVDSSKNTSPIATFMFGISLQLNPGTGFAGETVTIKGSGFNGLRPISITYDGTLVTTVAVTSTATGAFNSTFKIPGSFAGDHIIMASDGINTSSAVFVSMLTANMVPVTSATAHGYVGQEIIIEGKGFIPNSIVTVKYGTATVSSVTSSSNGSVTIKFKAKSSSAGEHVITLSDGINTKTFSYFMDSTPPLAPALMAPLDQALVKQPLIFEWSPVSDPSEVYYLLQISQDQDFNSILNEKRLMNDTIYIMEEAEKLPGNTSANPYYWRVLAIDGAGNTSQAAEQRTFIVGSVFDMIPPAAMFLGGAVGPLVLVGLSLMIIRRFSVTKSNPKAE